ncbi:hypothetical protein [Actinomadura sp. 21ATH]|uniref:hypothetical protein n=1 Tax=Actinomadura sp. 21ATH TaxID=1735444 RepID=UPI0035C055F4
MAKTMTPKTANCRGWGDRCWRNKLRQEAARAAAITAAVAQVDVTAFKDPAPVIAKAEQLLLDDALIATRVPGQYLANGSDGVSTYLTDTVERSCTCKAGARHGRCNHLVAGHAKNLLDQVEFTLALVA